MSTLLSWGHELCVLLIGSQVSHILFCAPHLWAGSVWTVFRYLPSHSALLHSAQCAVKMHRLLEPVPDARLPGPPVGASPLLSLDFVMWLSSHIPVCFLWFLYEN